MNEDKKKTNNELPKLKDNNPKNSKNNQKNNNNKKNKYEKKNTNPKTSKENKFQNKNLDKSKDSKHTNKNTNNNISKENKIIKNNNTNKEKKDLIDKKLNNDNSKSIDEKNKLKKEPIKSNNLKKALKSPKNKKDTIKETKKKIPKEKIIINDNSQNKVSNFKNELKDINNNNEIAKAIWNTEDITAAIKLEEDNNTKINNEIDELLIKEKKYNALEPFIIIILLIACFLGLYFILFTKDSAIISSALTNINMNLTNSLKEVNTLKEELNKGIKGTATFETTNTKYEKLKDFTYEFSLYNKNNNYYGNIKLFKDDKTLDNSYSYLNSNLYLKTPLYYYPLEINNPITINPLNINYANLNNNIEVIKNYLINNLKYTSSNKSKEDLNSEKFNVLTLNFSEEDANNSLKAIIEAIKNDTELISSIAKNIGLDEIKVNDFLNKEINITGNYQIKIYTKGFLQTFSGIKIYNADKEILEYLTNGNMTLNIYNKKKISFNLSDDKFLAYIDDIKLIDIKNNKNKNDLINLDFQVSNILNNYQGSLILTKTNDNKGEFIFSFKNTNNNDINAEIKMNLEFGSSNNNEFDYTDATNINDITDEEITDIKNNLINAIWDTINIPENNEEPAE